MIPFNFHNNPEEFGLNETMGNALEDYQNKFGTFGMNTHILPQNIPWYYYWKQKVDCGWDHNSIFLSIYHFSIPTSSTKNGILDA